MTETYIREGRPETLGAVITQGGVNFAVYSRDAVSVTLFLFEKDDSERPAKSFELDPVKNKTGDVWHIEIGGIGEGALYLYKIDGPYDPTKGFRFNKHKYIFHIVPLYQCTICISIISCLFLILVDSVLLFS